MPVVTSPLLREWELLQSEVIPPLVDVGRSRRSPLVWSVGSVADAVAVATAYRHADPARSARLRVFATGTGAAGPDLSPVTFSLSDIRCVPLGTRSKAFQRHHRGWVPDAAVADSVILSRPAEAVDLVTLRPGDGDRSTSAALERLRTGGHLLLIDGGDPLHSLPGLEPVGRGRVFRKTGDASPPAPEGAPRDGNGDLLTLGRQQFQSELVAGHARLARSLARRFSHHGESKDDLEQVALLALVKAARRYDTDRETSFSTYATASILGEIKRHFRDRTWMMRVPRSVQESYLAVKEARETLTHELSTSPTIQQIADRLGISDEAVLEAMEAGENYWPESLDVGVFEGESGREVPVTDPSFELALERQQLTSLLPRLAPRERLILKRLYFDGWTQSQVADEIGVSQMQVSRLLARTIEKLRAWIAE